MRPNYGAMARGMVDLGFAAAKTEMRLLGRWANLAAGCGSEFLDNVRDPEGGSVVGAAGGAARSYVRGLASLPELAMMDLAVELAARRRHRGEGP